MPSTNFVQNIDLGPGKTFYGGDYLGRTSGETSFSYELTTENVETEEDGKVGETISDDTVSITVPIFETDIDTLKLVIPWSIKDEETGILHIGKAVGLELSQFAKQVIIEPIRTSAKSKKLVIHKAYPKPGPVTFGYAKNGKRVANIQFIATRDEAKEPGKDFFDIVPVTPKCAQVIATPGSGQYDTAQTVKLSCATTGATIYYTIDGTVPTSDSIPYDEEIEVDAPLVIKAVAIKEEFADSDVAEYYYVGDLMPDG